MLRYLDQPLDKPPSIPVHVLSRHEALLLPCLQVVIRKRQFRSAVEGRSNSTQEEFSLSPEGYLSHPRYHIDHQIPYYITVIWVNVWLPFGKVNFTSENWFGCVFAIQVPYIERADANLPFATTQFLTFDAFLV